MELTTIMTQHGSDKGRGHHNYTIFYSELLQDLVDKPGVKVFELGIGTNNPNLPSSMGIEGIPGASLRGWRDWFKQADVYGADIDKDILIQEDRIKTYYVDQTSTESIKEMWSKIDVDYFDFIIDDGLHELDANYTFASNSYHKLKSGGYYIIEDIHEIYSDKVPDIKAKLEKLFSLVEYKVIPNPQNPWDNNIFIMRK